MHNSYIHVFVHDIILEIFRMLIFLSFCKFETKKSPQVLTHSDFAVIVNLL